MMRSTNMQNFKIIAFESSRFRDGICQHPSDMVAIKSLRNSQNKA